MSQPILIDESLFDETFTPERLVSREEQIKEIARCLSPMKNGKSARNLFIYGPPGTGKTSVCKWLMNEQFPKNSAYVNCWSKRTTHKIMEDILLQLGQMVHGRESASELIKKFEKLGKKVVVCLDESDHIRDPDVLYVLTRSACNVILISNQSFPLSLIDSRIRSSLLINEIEFRSYSADDISQILKERVAYGIRPAAVDDSMLSLIARMCSGDARVALQTLKIAAKEAESKDANRITIEEIKYAIKCSRKYKLSYLLSKLNVHQKTIYEILKGNGRMESGKLFATYSKVTKDHVVDRAYRNHMERMVELGLVRSCGIGRWKTYELAV